MIKLYLDWNVMAQMKSGHHDLFQEIINTDENFLLLYSTSHIGDILSSASNDSKQKIKIEEDLNFITSLTKNLCLFSTGNDIVTDYYDPKELFEQRLEDKDYFSIPILDRIQNSFSGSEFSDESAKQIIGLLRDMPLDSFLSDVHENPIQESEFEKMLPGFKDNPTIEGLINSMVETIKNLNEQDKYKDLRKITQKGTGINRDQIYDSLNPFEIINKSYERLGNFPSPELSNSQLSSEWFKEISNAYILLDMHGYQEDNVKTDKGRKETFKNTTEDAFHAAFASMCNFYVTNDKKSYKKTKQIYNKFNLKTIVLKPDEFVGYYKKYLNLHDLFSTIDIILEIFKSDFYVESKIENGFIRIFNVPFFFFGFFNKLMLLKDFDNEMPVFILSKEKPSNHSVTYRFEIYNLVSKLLKYFGDDLDNLGDTNDSEFETEEWGGRKWLFQGISFNLISLNNYIQLYIEF